MARLCERRPGWPWDWFQQQLKGLETLWVGCWISADLPALNVIRLRGRYFDRWGDMGDCWGDRFRVLQDLHDTEKENKGAYEKLIKAKRFLTEAARVQWLDFEVWNRTGVSQECSEVRRSTLPTFRFKQRRTADKTMNVSARLLCIWSHIAWLVIIGESRIYWYVIDIQMEREMNR